MDDSKEASDENNSNQNIPSEPENMDINPDEYTAYEAESGPSQASASTSKDVKSGAADVVGVPATENIPIKMGFGKPSCSKDKSNIRLTWECLDLDPSLERDLVNTVSMNAVLDIPYEKMIESVRTYFLKKRPLQPKSTSAKGTQTTPPPPPPPPAAGFNLQYDYQYSSDYDEDDSD